MVLRRDSIHKVHISEEMLWACVCNKSCLRGYSGTWLRRASCTEKFGVSGFTLGLLFYKSFVHQNTILNAIPQWFGLKRGLGFVLLKKKVCLLWKAWAWKNVTFQPLLMSSILKIFAPASPAWISAEHKRAYCKGSPYKEQPPPS